MNGWIIFWTIVLIAGLTLFTGLAVAVAIGGFFDVRAMFRRIKEEHQQEKG